MVKITSPKLAIIEDGHIFTGWEAYPKVGFIDLPEIPKVPQPKMWTRDGFWPWVNFTTPPTVPDFYEVEVNLSGMTWLAVLKFPDVTLEQWQVLGVTKYRKFKTPDAFVEVDNLDYLPALDAYNAAIHSYLVAIQGRFIVVGTHKLTVDNIVKLHLLPIPEDHPLYMQTWMGKVKSSCLLQTYDLKIKKLLGI